MATISEALAIAIQHQKGGRLQVAEQICQEILAVEPNHADALHLLGLIAHQMGRDELAAPYIESAIGLNPGNAACHDNLGKVYFALRRTDEAAACYQRALQLRPDFAEAHYDLGNLWRMQGGLDKAIVSYRRALQLRPDDFRSLNNLGAILKDQGKMAEAIGCFRQVMRLRPNDATPYNNLGAALRDQGSLDEAIACYRQGIQLAPHDPALHHNLGTALQDQGRWEEAIACCCRAVKLKPDYTDAHNNLGNAFQAGGKLEEAVACYRRALELRPDYVEAHNNMGGALRGQGKLDDALGCYRRALELKPDYAEAHNNLGNALKDLGRLDEALACYRRALELKPDYAEAYSNVGNVLKDEGSLDEALTCFRRAAACWQRALQIRPRPADVHNRLGKVFGQLAFVLGSRLPEDDLIAMRQLLLDANVCGDSRIALQFALAQVLDTAGNYDEAAELLRQANALRSADLHKRNQEYKPAKHRGFVDSLIATCTPQFFARMSGFGLETELPVFIFGLPRSGTTLAEQILASHSQVFGAGELYYCEEMFQFLPKAMLRNDTPLECLRDLDRKTARDLAQRHVERLQALDKRALRVVDKTPGNYHFLGLIGTLFPQARLIHCRRDLRDVAVSCWMTDFAGVAWACNPDHIASHFDAYRRLMDHWQDVSPLPFLDVDYEEMVEDPEGVARRIVAWCGLEWEVGCLKFYETRRPVRTASAAQVRQPIYKSSVGRWKNYEASLGELFSSVWRSNSGAASRVTT